MVVRENVLDCVCIGDNEVDIFDALPISRPEGKGRPRYPFGRFTWASKRCDGAEEFVSGGNKKVNGLSFSVSVQSKWSSE